MPNLTVGQVKAASVACTIVSLGSAVASPVLIIKANKKANAILDHYEMQDETLRYRMKLTWKCYIPAGVVIAVGMAASVTNGILTHRVSSTLAAEIASHAFTIANNAEVKEAILTGIKDKYGLDVEQEMRNIGTQTTRDQVLRQMSPTTLVRQNVADNAGHTLLCDDMHGRYFWGSMEDVKKALNSVNEGINHGEEMTMEDFYQFLGMETGSIDKFLAPRANELLEMDTDSSVFEDQACLHFYFKNLVAEPLS